MKDGINLHDLWILMKENGIKLLTYMFIGLGVSGILTFFVIPPQYGSETQLIAQLPKNSQDIGNGVNNNLMMINTYKDLVKSNLVINSAMHTLNNRYHYNLTNKSLNKSLVVSQEQNSQMFTIKAKASSPQMAKNIANVVAETFQKKAMEVMRVDKISITSGAVSNNKPVSPNNVLNLFIGIFLGFIVGIIVIVVRYLYDTTIKDEDWISNNLGITILGSIPEMTSKELSVHVKKVDTSIENMAQSEAVESSENEQRRHRRRV